MMIASAMLILFLLPASSSAKTQEFSGNILSGENIDIDEFTFIITMNKYANAIFVDAGKIFRTVPIETCKKMDRFEICFDNTTYDEEENDLYAIVRIYRYEPSLAISKTVNDTELYVGQDAQVTIKITNSGDTASQIILTDDYPASIEISEMEGGCSQHENQVYWQGHLDETEEKECKFLIKATKELHQSFVAHMKYWDGFRWKDEYSNTITMDFEPVVKIYSSIVREDYEVDGTTFDFEDENPGVNIGETLRLLVNITNNYDDKIRVDALEINLPPDIKYESTGHLRFNFLNATGNRSSIVWYSDRVRKINDRQLRWEGLISTNKSSRLFVIKLLARRTGDQNIIINTRYNYDDMSFSEDTYENFAVGDPGLGIRMTVEDQSKRFSAPTRLDEDDDTIDLEALHPYNIKVYAQNINKYAILKDVNFKVITDLAGFKTVHYAEMDEEGQRIPYSIILIPPQVGASTLFKTNVSATYQNEFGERYANSTEFDITVVPSKDLTITQDSSEGWVLDGGEESEVKITVNNDRLIEIKNVQVTDEISPELEPEGVHAKKVKLNKESETEVYTYRIKAPILHEKIRYNITTTVSFFDPDSRLQRNVTKTETVTVEPLKPDVSIEMTLDEPENIYPGTLIPVEYTIHNNEEKELVTKITAYFPIQAELDLIGPRTFFIDKLEPGEEVTIKNLIKIRPKIVTDSLKINKTRVEYYDNYGNLFDENSSEESLDVDDARINGPSLSIRTVVPEVVNKSQQGTIKIEVRNDGTDSATATVEQGDKIWNITVPASSTKTIEYNVKYDTEGNYTLPDPVVKFDFQGVDAYTKGSGAVVNVKLLLGPVAEAPAEAAAQPAEKAEVPEAEKEEMSLEEYEALQKVARTKEITKYGLISGGIILIIMLIAAYIYFAQKKGGAAQPFIESEKS